MKPTLVAVLAGIMGAGACAAQTVTFNDVPVGVVPTDAGGTLTLRMDIYKPAGATTATPVAVWIHGGAWLGGSYNAGLPGIMQPLLNSGISVATIGYRLSSDAIFPAQIHDVKGAIRHLRANAQTYGINPSRIGAWGSSAGGHLTALLATSGGVSGAEGNSGGNLGFSSRIMAGVDYFGPTDLLNMSLDVTNPPGSTFDHDAPGSPESRLIGFSGAGEGIGVLRANQSNPNPPFTQKMALVTLANSITHIGYDDPAMFVAHGTMDTTVPMGQSTRLHNALTAAGVPHTYLEVAGAGHGPLGTATDAAARAFLMQHLLAIDGDANLDGRTDSADFNRLATFFGRPGAWRHGDFDNNGMVNSSDFNILARNFGAGLPASAVPEPAVSALLAPALLLLVWRRK